MKNNCTCPLCGSDKVKLVLKHTDMRFGCWGFRKKILECENCTLQFLYPTWSKYALSKIYDGYNQQKDFDKQKVVSKRITPYLTKYFCKCCDDILEVGCGSGHNVRRLLKRGYSIMGIDKDPAVKDEENHIYNWDFFGKEVEKHKYTFIYAIHLFEHITDPKRFVKKLYSLLDENGGTYLLEVPNLEDPLLSIYKSEAFKKFYYVPHHVFFYTPKTIELMFDTINHMFRVKRIQRYGLINHLRWLIFKRPGNINWHIPILDDIYKFILVHLFKKSDTLIVIGER